MDKMPLPFPAFFEIYIYIYILKITTTLMDILHIWLEFGDNV